ncbi:MAG: helix-turn-helix transcriptional regulator [Candidatus Promineifilaceae bacterium]
MDNTGSIVDIGERRLQLGRFLRECRERIGPQAVGLPMTGRRRTPGLRREELSALAGISVTYYTKIEQGRVDVSERVLETLADVLRLSHTERDYAFALARDYDIHYNGRPQEVITPALKRFLQLQEPYPAQIMGRAWDFLAWNQATCAVLGDLEQIPPQMRNLVVMMFTIPEMRQGIGDWEKNAKCILAEFRADYGKYHNQPRFGEVIAFLTDSSPEFAAWWSEHTAIGCQAETDKVIEHPAVGTLNLVETALISADHPCLRVLLLLPQDTQTIEKLQTLYDAHMGERAGRGSNSRRAVQPA